MKKSDDTMRCKRSASLFTAGHGINIRKVPARGRHGQHRITKLHLIPCVQAWLGLRALGQKVQGFKCIAIKSNHQYLWLPRCSAPYVLGAQSPGLSACCSPATPAQQCKYFCGPDDVSSTGVVLRMSSMKCVTCVLENVRCNFVIRHNHMPVLDDRQRMCSILLQMQLGCSSEEHRIIPTTSSFDRMLDERLSRLV